MSGASKRAEHEAAVRRLLNPASPDARLVWAYLGALCHAGTTTLVPGDPYATAAAEGRRQVFLHLTEIVGGVTLPEGGPTDD